MTLDIGQNVDMGSEKGPHLRGTLKPSVKEQELAVQWVLSKSLLMGEQITRLVTGQRLGQFPCSSNSSVT